MALVTTLKTMETTGSVAGRYQIQELLGEGGMGAVYLVHENATGRELALKRMFEQAKESQDSSKHFEQEFHTLCHLQHPCVVEVYDYGVDGTTPYYTMELLDGGDLKELSPLPWQRTCVVLRDICSLLSLIHSRRLVHRDVTPRNIRCTRNGRAKLIDFGAMVPMESHKPAVGTPSFTAPEVANMQALDARADLFSLGATAYFALTLHNAYPARNFDTLRDAWRTQPVPPSRYNPSIPAALDTLVMSLLNLDAMGRPVSAAEVIERLNAIAGLPAQEELVVPRAYLSKPTLVGREKSLLNTRKLVIAAMSRQARCLTINGASGVGRTRFLDACVLEAKIAGATVLRADATDSHSGEWGATRALLTQLLDARPEEASRALQPHLAVLETAIPKLRDRLHASSRTAMAPPTQELAEKPAEKPPEAPTEAAPEELAEKPEELRRIIYEALVESLLVLSRTRLFMVAIDDVHLIDEPTAAFLALLCSEISENKLLLVATYETGAPATAEAARMMLSQTGTNIKLRNLNAEQTLALMRSLFNDAPNTQLLANRIYNLSEGNPGAIMRLAQHLLDTGRVRFRSGTWSLPERLDASDLPLSTTDALRVRAQRFDSEARELVQAMALRPEQRFDFDECMILCGQRDSGRLMQHLQQLVTAEVLATDGKYYAFRQPGWAQVFVQDIDEEQERPFHFRLAEVFERRGDERFRTAQHLLLSGEDERAVDLLFDLLEEARETTEEDPRVFSAFIRSLPKGWIETLESALSACQRLGKPSYQSYVMRRAILAYCTDQAVDPAHIAAIVAQLYQDSGLLAYDQLEGSLEDSVRLQKALEVTQQRYDALSEAERVLPPLTAIRDVARVGSFVGKVVVATLDYDLFDLVPSLQPLAPLAPVLDLIRRIDVNSKHLRAGRYERMIGAAVEMLTRIEQPDRAGLEDGTMHKMMRLTTSYTTALYEAGMGLKRALDRTDILDTEPLYRINAWQARMFYYQRQGDSREAERCKKKMELLLIQDNPAQFFTGCHLWLELLPYGLSDDLMGVAQLIVPIEERAGRFQGWLPVLYFARGEYQRIRGDYQVAVAEYERALQLISAGRQPIWAYVAGSHLLALFGLGRYREAKALGYGYLASSDAVDLGYLSFFIKRAVALIEAVLGEYESAIEMADGVIAACNERGISGINLGVAYEARAYIAMMMDDREGFLAYARLCATEYKVGDNPVLTAKHERMMREAEALVGDIAGEAESPAETGVVPVATQTLSASQVSEELFHCVDHGQRLQATLDILVKQSGASGGFLYTIQAGAPVLSAQNGALQPSADLDRQVYDFLRFEIGDTEDRSEGAVTSLAPSAPGEPQIAIETKTKPRTTTPPIVPSDARELQPGPRHFFLLTHEDREQLVITGLAVLLTELRGKVLNHCLEIGTVLSRSLADTGDATMMRPE